MSFSSTKLENRRMEQFLQGWESWYQWEGRRWWGKGVGE
jgi:hypothetical protein